MSQRQFLVPFWIGWTFANTVAGAIVGAFEAGGLQFTATLILSGLIAGVAQWLVLRHRLRVKHWWWLSTVGWLAGTLLMIHLSGWIDPIVRFLWQLGGWEVLWLNVLNQPIILAGMGFAQWWILRRYLHQAQWWILISAIAGIAQGAVGASVCAATCTAMTQAFGAIGSTAVTYAAGWAGYGIVTGIGFERLYD